MRFAYPRHFTAKRSSARLFAKWPRPIRKSDEKCFSLGFHLFSCGYSAIMKDSDDLSNEVPLADAVEQRRDASEPVLDEESSADSPGDRPLEATDADWQEQLETVDLDVEEDRPDE
jgi:hypothetical protein